MLFMDFFDILGFWSFGVLIYWVLEFWNVGVLEGRRSLILPKFFHGMM